MKSKTKPVPSVTLPFLAACVLLGAYSARADYASTILADHPAAYYRLEESPGAGAAADSSGNGFDGAINYDVDINLNPDYPRLAQPGIGTNSFLFHNYADTNAQTHVSDVDVTFNPVLNPQGPFSVEFWARATSDANNYDIPVGSFGGYGDSSGWDFYQTPGAPGSWVFNVPSAGAFIQTSQVVKNQWTHLVGVYDGVNLIFYVNGVATATVSGAGYLANSANDLFIGGDSPSGWGNFEGYIDEVAIYTNALTADQVMAHYQAGLTNFSTAAAPPEVLKDSGETTTDPASITINEGSSATFDPIVAGGTPFSYQWFKNGTIDEGQTNSILAYTPSLSDDGATFFVVVTNNYGSSTSEVATLNINAVLDINSSPQPITREVGSDAAFHVTASGASPIHYQWSVSADGGTTFNTIPGATNETLWLSNVSMAQNGYEYSVLVTADPGLSENVAAATLTVVSRSNNPVFHGYASLVAADKPVAFWQLDDPSGSSTAVDSIGSFDGAYTIGLTNGTPDPGSITYGVTGGIPNDTGTGVGLTNGATIQIPFAPELNPDIPWSVETWVQPSSLGANGGDYRVVLSSEYNLYPNPYNGWYIYQQPNNTFAFVPEPGNQFIVGGSIVAGQWYHLVVTDDGNNFNLYINGVLAVAPFPVASADFIPNGDGINLDGSAGITSGLGNFVIGQRTDAAFGTFLGNVEDTAVYNYALTPQQIELHYLNAVQLQIASQAGGKVVLTWPAGTGTLQSSTSLTGTFSDIAGATPPYTNSISGSAIFYRIRRN